MEWGAFENEDSRQRLRSYLSKSWGLVEVRKRVKIYESEWCGAGFTILGSRRGGLVEGVHAFKRLESMICDL